ncbi:unnamed protein product [Mycena citricolor]|uniref:Molybdenum cofactor sulfurase n=1 Tax=Mycena citricolor TaxID=2018698 RepID=A0AAD2HQN7_9AGAR|nr:unnamed protein product [Mycena citricolor]
MQAPEHISDIDAKRHEFYDQAGSDYGYGLGSDAFHALRSAEYPSLHGTTFLDYAASAPAPVSTIRALADAVSTTLFSNPHSRAPASVASSLEIEQCRGRILEDLFGLDEAQRADWDVVFTSGATASLKLVGESFPWGRGTKYVYLKTSHTSLVGIRGCALACGAEVLPVSVEDVPVDLAPASLFAYSAQCNSTGQRLGLGYAQRVKERCPDVYLLVDAAAYLSTAVLDLGSIPIETAPDFVSCSFYKIFGYPTGLGCLVVKRASSHVLQRRGYFGGGTVDGLSVESAQWMQPRRPMLPGTVHERFEDGTVSYLSIVALARALDTHKRLYKSHRHVAKHVSSLVRFATGELASLRHANGKPVVQQHRSFAAAAAFLEDPGPIIGFTLLDDKSKPLGHVHLEQLAAVNGFQIRTGGLCNTGVVASVFDLTDKDLKGENDRGRACWDDEEFGGLNREKPLGLARISFGASSTIDDVLQWISFVRRYFVMSTTVIALSDPVADPDALTASATLDTAMLYPIKSCGGQSLQGRWKVVPTGLLYDREWMLVNSASGRTLSQKQYSRMALIRPSVDIRAGILLVRALGMPDLALPLARSAGESAAADTNLCADIVPSSPSDPKTDAWFSEFLGISCSLRRVALGAERHGHFEGVAGAAVPILLSNESPFLLISRASVDQLNAWIAPDDAVKADCFRANFTIAAASLPAFHEDGVDLVRIGKETFQVLARCRRCLMVCIDQATGIRTREPLSCLARRRKNARGKIEFGVHLLWRKDLSTGDGWVNVGDQVVLASLK